MNLLEAMREAVAERGADWVYPQPVDGDSEDNWRYSGGICRYVTRDEKKGACLIGVALLKLGYKPEDIDVKTASGSLLEHLGDFSASERAAANMAQAHQDYGVTWGEALEKAEKEYKKNA